MVSITASDEDNSVEDESASARVKNGQKDQITSLNSQLAEIRESLERLTKSVGELNSKMRSTGDVMKWVLDALSHRSEERETTYLKNLEASNELIKSFMAFVESRVKPVARSASAEGGEPKVAKKEPQTKEVVATPKKGEEYLVKPSLVRRFQEEETKDKEKKSR
jgi:peptidoglycan hydrolase CwlO-like protein